MTIVKGEINVDIDKLVSLEKDVDKLNQTIGAQRETVKVLESRNNELRAKQAEELERVSKEVRIVTEDKNKSSRCPSCGWYHSDKTWVKCNQCGYYENSTALVYKGLDDVVEMVRKEESKRLKIDSIELEKRIEQLEFDKAKKDLEHTKLVKTQETAITEAKSKQREIFNENLEKKDKAIDALKAEIKKIIGDKTDAQIEEQRMQEIIDLKLHIEEIEKDKETLVKLLPIWKQRKFNDTKAKQEALVEITNKEERVEMISNAYPRVRRAEKGLKDIHIWITEKTNSLVNLMRNRKGLHVEVENPYGW